MNRAGCSQDYWQKSVCYRFREKFVPVFLIIEKKTAMNISEAKVNKLEINIYAPGGM